MDSFEAFAAMGGKIKWVGDRVSTTADFKPRHIDRPITFTLYESDDSEDYSSRDVLGTFQGSVGELIVVSNDVYKWARVGDVKIWRREVGQ